MYLNTGAEVGTVHEDFGAVSQTHLTRTLQCSSTMAQATKVGDRDGGYTALLLEPLISLNIL